MRSLLSFESEMHPHQTRDEHWLQKAAVFRRRHFRVAAMLILTSAPLARGKVQHARTSPDTCFQPALISGPANRRAVLHKQRERHSRAATEYDDDNSVPRDTPGIVSPCKLACKPFCVADLSRISICCWQATLTCQLRAQCGAVKYLGGSENDFKKGCGSNRTA